MVEPQYNSASYPSPRERTVRRPRRRHLWLLILNLLYALFLLTLFCLNAMGPEQWWLSSLNLYLPQWLWALPFLLLLPLTGWLTPRRIAIPLAGLIYCLGPGMGLCLNLPSRHAAPGVHLRIMTYNVKWDSRDETAVFNDITRQKPDILQMQDAVNLLDGPMRTFLKGWNVRAQGQYILASRYPIVKIEDFDLSFPGYHHDFVRATLTIRGRQVFLYNVHLLSPREGLVAVRHRHIDPLEENVARRVYQSETLTGYLRKETAPTLLTGDLNSPVQAIACHNLMATGLRDAFSEAGLGYGYTYGQYTKLRHPFMRIDHILYNSPWQAEKCWVGNTEGSDHVPVIADLFLPTAKE